MTQCNECFDDFVGFVPQVPPLARKRWQKFFSPFQGESFSSKKNSLKLLIFSPEDLSIVQAVIVVHFTLNEYYSSFFPKTCQFTKRGFPLRHPRVARLPERGGRSSKR